MISRMGSQCVFRASIPGAVQVYLVGDVNGSAKARPMRQTGFDSWELSLDLPPGSYRFRYYADDGACVTYVGPADATPASLDRWDSILTVPPSEN